MASRVVESLSTSPCPTFQSRRSPPQAREAMHTLRTLVIAPWLCALAVVAACSTAPDATVSPVVSEPALGLGASLFTQDQRRTRRWRRSATHRQGSGLPELQGDLGFAVSSGLRRHATGDASGTEGRIAVA